MVDYEYWGKYISVAVVLLAMALAAAEKDMDAAFVVTFILYMGWCFWHIVKERDSQTD